MGLDMYLFRKEKPKEKEIAAPFDHAEVDNQLEEIGYWRKHPDLHRLIEQFYIDAGGTGDFNCVRCLLSREHLEEILERTKTNTLPANEGGFFFGQSDYSNTASKGVSVEESLQVPMNPDDEDSYLDDHQSTYLIIKNALQLMDEGYEIYYDSSW